MRVLTEQEYGLFERIATLSQQELHKTLSVYLKGKYNKVITTEHYIIAIGDIPIALLAHLDTVFYNQMQDMYYDMRKGVLWSPQGLGADDRAGIFAILNIIQAGYRPSVIFTVDEEKGGLGAKKLSKIDCPIPILKYLIQLDRRGNNDCVFYDCLNEEFMSYVESFGFIEAIGSYSDISFIMPKWKICGVNLSIGYEDEHSATEILHVNAMFKTIDKVKRMLDDAAFAKYWPYQEIKNHMKDFWIESNSNSAFQYDDDIVRCGKCNKMFFDFELIPIKGYKPHKATSICPDCVVELDANWCEACGLAFIPPEGYEDIMFCDDCMMREDLTD